MPSFKVDLHIHTNFSDGKLSVHEIVDLYGRKGFGAIAITDHLCETDNLVGKVSHRLNYSLNAENFNQYQETIKAEAARAFFQYNMLVIPGFEITKNSFKNHRSAHILILGTDQFINPNLSIDEILDEARAQNAFVIAAHPFYTGEFEFQTFQLWSRRETLKDKIDAWEVNYRKSICQEVLVSGLPLIANSDFHNKSHFESWKTTVHADALCPNEIFEAIRRQQIDFFLDRAETDSFNYSKTNLPLSVRTTTPLTSAPG